VTGGGRRQVDGAGPDGGGPLMAPVLSRTATAGAKLVPSVAWAMCLVAEAASLMSTVR